MNHSHKNLALGLAMAIIIILLFNFFKQSKPGAQKILFSEFKEAVDRGSVLEVTIQGNNIYGDFTDGTEFETYAINDYGLVSEMIAKGIPVDIRPDEQSSWWMQVFISWFPMLLLIGVWFFFMRQMQSGGSPLSLGKSKARLLAENRQKITFEDVAGIDEAKEEVEEIIAFLKDPRKFTKLGGKLPKG